MAPFKLRLPVTPLAFALTIGLPGLAFGQGFAAYISPPRFELQLKPGERSRQVIEIQHVGRQKGDYRFYTNDWTLAADNSVNFEQALATDSCRPWVAIERKTLTLDPGAKFRYRFEIAPPANTPDRECRFALMVEGIDPAQVQGAISFPVSGRIGVIVYARIGNAAPKLQLERSGVVKVNDQPGMAIFVRNAGNAHGRLTGFLNATDAKGQTVELAPADLPILPGESREVPLMVVRSDDGQAPPALQYPVDVAGQLEWDDQKMRVESRFTP